MGERDLSEVFKRNYLSSVACEVRFDPLLVIQNSIPEFQKIIRNKLPNIKRDRAFQIPEFSLSPSEPYQWIFSSTDEIKALRITINRISFVVSKYNDFKTFYPEMINYFKEFFKVCEIKEYSRIGLRYVNEIPLNDLEESEEMLLLKYFNPIIDVELFNKLKPSQFDGMLRWSKKNNNFAIRNRFRPRVGGTDHYIIDIDSYQLGKINESELEKIINNLQNLLIEEFYRNITDEFIKVLRREE